MTSKVLKILTALSLANLISAAQPYIRYNSGCQLLLGDTRIYCYSGGYAKAVNGEITPLKDHYYLDVSNDFDVSANYVSWYTINDPPNFVTEATSAYTSVKLNDSSVLINGGTGINNGINLMTNQTVIYNADLDQWTTVSNTSSIPQTYYGSGAIGSDGTIVFWGGVQAIGDYLPTFNGTATLTQLEWGLQPTAVAPGYNRYGHTATIDKTGTAIYFLGGRDIVQDPTTGAYTRPYTTFTSLLIYNTTTSVWQQRSVTSTSPPTNRMSHTANLLPDGNIIIYGGATADSIGNRLPVTDYIHLFNPTANTFQPISISGSTTGAGARFGHNAVVRNNSLFILFGIDSTLAATADFHILDLTTYSWVNTYYANGSVPVTSATNSTNGNSNNNNNNNNNSNNNSNSNSKADSDTDKGGLSSGAIAGIVVGIVAAVGIAIAFLLYKRHQNKNKEKEVYPSYWDVTSINDTGNMPEATPPFKDLEKVASKPPAGDSTVTTTIITSVSDEDKNKVWPPDVPNGPQTVLPDSSVDHVKPDVGKK